MAAMKWTLAEFDQQPFPLVLELMDHFAVHPPESILMEAFVGFKPQRRRKRKMAGYDNETEFRAVGMLPDAKNTVPDETSLPDWARQARQLERARKMAEQIQRKANG